MKQPPEADGSQERFKQFVARHYPAWYLEYCLPVSLALTAYAWGEAEAGLARADAALPALDPSAQDALALVSATQRYFLALHRYGPEAALRLWPELKARLETPSSDRFNEPLRRRQLAIHRCQAARLGWQALPREELDQLLDGLGLGDYTQYLWHELAMHAYLSGWEDLLQQAYSELSVANDGLMSNWFWRHSRLMQRLLHGTVQLQDVDATLAALRFASQVLQLRQTVLQPLRERGWLSLAQVEAVAGRLELAGPPHEMDLLK